MDDIPQTPVPTSENGKATALSPNSFTRSEIVLLLILVAVQFTHMVDFVIIMPLGDRLRHELKITPDQFGSIVAAYAWAAGLASLLASFIIDRFDRKAALLTLYAGFAVSTFYCGLADDYQTMLIGRTLAGVCGGLAAVSLMAVIADVFPVEKRGRATGAVVSAFAVASVIGLPIGLVLAEKFGRGAPFYALAALSGLVWLTGFVKLPSVRGHLAFTRKQPLVEFVAVVRDVNHLWGFAFSFFLVLGTFTVASFIGPVFSATNGWKEQALAGMYAMAGLATLVATNVVGRLSDRYSRLVIFRVLGTLSMIMAVVVSNLPQVSWWVGAAAMTGFMVFAASRMVPAQAMILGICQPSVRGAFMSLNTAIQHLATGLAPTIAGAILRETKDGKLVGFSYVGLVCAAAAGIGLVLAGYLKPATIASANVIPSSLGPEEGLPVVDVEDLAVA